MSANENLTDRDAQVSWHPYTQHALEPAPLPVRSARGAVLVLEDGRELIDAISSWWAILHGHAEPRLLEVMAAQARELDHVLFAGCTHEPAVRLAESLIEVAPEGLSRVFFSDNGSTAVEVALKMVFQGWVHRGEEQRRTFVALEGAYHGDTFGAMAIGDPEPFFRPFEPLLFRARRVPPRLDRVERAFDELGEEAAGIILEPLLQAAGGMILHGADFLRGVRAACDRRGLPLIADEVMTGFGRTGALFACGKAGIAPDLMCLSKGLTGGILPLAATLAREELFEAFLSSDRGRAFFHGHTFTAHPVGCAVALASLELCRERDVPARLEAIGARIQARIGELEPSLAPAVRRIGGVVAFDLPTPEGGTRGYLAERAPRLRREAIERGVLLRPLGDVLYAMPPACTRPEQCDRIAQVMVELARLTDG